MNLWDKALDFLVSTIGQSAVDSWRKSSDVDNDILNLRAALPKARLLIERSECWRLPKYNPIDELLSQLKDSVYEAESIIDELEYQRLKNKVEKSFPGISNILRNWMNDFPTTVKRVLDRLNNVYNEMKETCDSRGIPENPNQFSQTARPITSTFLDTSHVYGRDKELNEMIHLMGVPSSGSGKRKRAEGVSLSNLDIGESSSRMDNKQNVSVLSIVGMGGVGKTTLAQMVCNDQSVMDYFDLIMWVCVSDNFDPVRLTKEMIESATRKDCNLTNLDRMQKDLKDTLNLRLQIKSQSPRKIQIQGGMILWDKAVEFLVSTIGQSVVDTWRRSNDVDSHLSKLRAALPEARRLIERSECWRLPIYDPIDKLLYQLKDSVYEAESIVDELEYQRLKNRVENNFPGIRNILTIWMRDFPTKVKGVQDRLNKVYNEMKAVCDRRGIPENPNQFSQKARPTTSTFLDISKVYGRDKEFNEVIRLMGVPSSGSGKRKRAKRVTMSNLDIGESSSRMDKKQNVSVLSIVGMGGVGKTTLAQLVCNDKSVIHYFDLIMWVCVSDNFDKVTLTKQIIESATKEECNLTNLHALQVNLQETLNFKRFLLVLDDVWSKDWQCLLAPMEGASEGSVALVTTRSPECVDISGTSLGSRGVINLEGLEEHIYWEFFKSCAFDSVSESNNINPELEVIGKEICKRLKGSPLAAKTIGGTLKNNSGVEHWMNIKDSKMWELQKEEYDILPVLQLSYQYLPTYLKKCFSFCSLYPKDFQFTQSELTEFWMMHGFIGPLDNDKEFRTLAHGYFDDLVRRGFFQKLTYRYVIHDLMHDVCLSITNDECFCLENGHSEQKVSLDIRHASVFQNEKFLKELCKYKKLLSLKVCTYSCSITGIETWCNELKNIRSLSLARCGINKLPENIGNLKHLQFLDISGTKFETLPESFCNLYNLRFLNMNNCSKIECFPDRFNNLVNLQLFYLPFEMVHLVERFENIVKAILLYNLTVSLQGNKKIEILKNLCKISGSLCIKDLEYVPSKEAAQKAQLNNKPFINRLELTWQGDCRIGHHEDHNYEVLDGLCPHHNLKELKIDSYRGRILSPSWLKEEFLPNLTVVEFHYCWKVSTISHLPRSITKLVINGLDQLENLQDWLEPNHLPALKHIQVNNCRNLETLSVESFGGFESLEQLIITLCSKLRCPNAMVLPPSVKSIKLGDCGDLEKSIPSCLQNLTSLETLAICGCKHLISIPAEVTSNLKSLSTLYLDSCDKLQSLGGPQFLASLQEVYIMSCPQLDETRGQLPSELLQKDEGQKMSC